ncbi:gamma-glutamyl-gamma-aminobutyrate hydrolase family protein [Shewanella sp. FJAT-52076]|uniref:gamma-glutamyl-gamma-aminobutyrate hydrolase family protein n=1 Tax=Shewanella sp. FJAT-52076 TaxID=2864202 RepID=UPI001C65C970|nr:gamma-glutamyl-gamma-aminobutyrate hydrolase family protein [Shewanella sp. FJAT-52076]QYJ74138.1 gamma-glutamyl-gamma-aminobutyrate hydrolase family protein [Shewanella sp. FJAT-52076]
MKAVFITQQHSAMPHGEWHASLDRSWPELLDKAGLIAICLPNDAKLVSTMLEQIDAVGAVLTGGGVHLKTGADCRSEVERVLIRWSLEKRKPLLGVCRGMQALCQHFDAELKPVTGHVKSNHLLQLNGRELNVNSYHNYGFYSLPEQFDILATASDGVVESCSCPRHGWLGMMWHPERELLPTKLSYPAADNGAEPATLNALYADLGAGLIRAFFDNPQTMLTELLCKV